MICPYCKTENRAGAVKCAACASWMVEYPPIREWLRAREGKLIAGVCRGLANRFGVPVAALRLAFILSVLLGGWGIVVYIALWIAMPLPPEPVALVSAPPPPPPQHPVAQAPGS
jgi:phage shock protein PspC (stress-responsive transcriptional regulator)